MPDESPHREMLDYGQVGNTYYLAMEFVEGMTWTRCSCSGARWVDQAVTIASQSRRCPDCGPPAGVVHRDIKPQNIKLRPDGTAKVLDFGIARATDGTRLTQTGAFIGTPLYMAPEIWEGQPAGPPADIYSLGVVLYELIAGRPPFRADTPAAIMRQQLMEEPRPLNAVRVDTPPQLVWIVSRCLAKAPAQRYASADDLLVALQGKAEAARPARRRTGAPQRSAPRFPSRSGSPAPCAGSKRANSVLSAARDWRVASPAPICRDGRAEWQAIVSAFGAGYGAGAGPQLCHPFADRYLSQHHARVFFINGRFYLYDLNSHNGTYLNGYRLSQPHALQHGDQVQIGESFFTFSAPSSQQAGAVYRGRRTVINNQLLAAAAAHISVVAIPVVVPLLIWLTNRSRSPYVSHQAKQALLYQGLYLALMLVLGEAVPFCCVSPAVIWLLATAGGHTPPCAATRAGRWPCPSWPIRPSSSRQERGALLKARLA